MTLTLQTFLIVCPMLFLAGLVDAIGGGGGLISLPAYLLAGLPMHNTIATNKLSSTCGTALTTIGGDTFARLAIVLNDVNDGSVGTDMILQCRICVSHSNSLEAVVADFLARPVEQGEIEHTVNNRPVFYRVSVLRIVPYADKVTA